MANHRADHRAAPRVRSERSPKERYVGRRVAGREQAEAAALRSETAPPAAVVPTVPTVPTPLVAVTDPATTPVSAPGTPGKRKAVKHAGPRGPLFRGLPSLPVAVGLATLAVAVGGVVTSTDTQLAASGPERVAAPNAASGSIGSGTFDALGRTPTLSRDSQRDALEDASDAELVAEAEQQVEQRNARLGELAQQAETAAKEINLNAWVLPLEGYRLSARFNQPGPYWSSGYHTGLDFSASEGQPIQAVANGVITSVGYDGAYGNKTVLTLEDGTELWFCHQSAFAVDEGQEVRAGEVIGYVGNTGNSYGSHLHLEVRPGGGDPVDPYEALAVNGVTP